MVQRRYCVMQVTSLRSVKRNVCICSQTKANFPFICDSFRWTVAIFVNYSQTVFWRNQNGGLCEYDCCMLVRYQPLPTTHKKQNKNKTKQKKKKKKKKKKKNKKKKKKKKQQETVYWVVGIIYSSPYKIINYVWSTGRTDRTHQDVGRRWV